jgi:hypothetical protein
MDFYDLADSLREHEDIAREHARHREYEITMETLDTGAIIIAALALVAFWFVLRP